MSTFKFLHTADIHLDSPLHRLEAYEGAPVEKVRQASRRAFENLVDLAVAEPVDFVVIAGDLFDGDWKDYNTGLYFVAQAQRLKAAGIPVFIVAGNHDAAGRMTRRLPYPDNVHVFAHRAPETRRLEGLKVALHGQSFAAPAVTDNLALGFPAPEPGYFNIGVLHTSLNGREGHESYAPCTLADLESRGYDYWALGHVHRYERVAAAPTVVFPGCVQGRHVKEAGAKGAVLVSVADGAAPQVVHQPLDVVRWEHLAVDLEGVENRQEGLERFKNALEAQVNRHQPLTVIARVTFGGPTPAHARIAGDLTYWQEAVRSTALACCGDGAWVEKVQVHTHPPGDGSARAGDPGPLRELEALAAAIRSDEAALLALGGELAALFRKLPAEYRQGEAAIDPQDPDLLRRLVDQAHLLLVEGLKKEGPAA